VLEIEEVLPRMLGTKESTVGVTPFWSTDFTQGSHHIQNEQS
jgi:hypothetical protein